MPIIPGGEGTLGHLCRADRVSKLQNDISNSIVTSLRKNSFSKFYLLKMLVKETRKAEDNLNLKNLAQE